jgi:uncharacterized damage-inducible protein DinB
MTTDQFRQFAAHNRWANARLSAAALDFSNQAYRLHKALDWTSHILRMGVHVRRGF